MLRTAVAFARVRACMMVAALAAASAIAPGCAKAPPPFGEALFVVDTDLPVPLVANRLRVDLFAADGTWYESRDVSLRGAGDWPASFSVFSPDQTKDVRVLVRLRAYPEGFVRDYRGEQFIDRGQSASALASTGSGPRLLHASADATPLQQPQPFVTVDRLVLVRLRSGVAGRVRVTLRGACSGTMPMLSASPPDQTVILGEAQTCVDTEGVRTPMTEAPLEADMTVPAGSQAGTFGVADACPAATPGSKAVCVPGGVVIMGAAALATGGPIDPAPEHVAVVSTFWLDRREVSVADLRGAVARGLSPSGVLPNDGPIDAGPVPYCTYTTAPADREQLPVSCVRWSLADAYCHAVGGALPTEAQYEYAATMAGRAVKADYAWGDATPACTLGVWGRWLAEPNVVAGPCGPPGPVPVSTSLGDVTPFGAENLAGNVREWALDDAAPYADPCWTGAPLHDPSCHLGAPAAPHPLRGGAWLSQPFGMNGAQRVLLGASSDVSIGFRCAYGRAPGGP